MTLRAEFDFSGVAAQLDKITKAAKAATRTVQASIRLRHRTGIHSGMRVVSGGATYNILAVLPDEAQRQHTDLVCEVTS